MSDTPQVSISSRLERLGLPPYLIKLVALVIISYYLSAYSLTGINYLMPSLSKQFELSPVQSGYISSIVFVTMFLGAFIGGLIADKIGRKPVLGCFMFIWGIGNILMGLAPSVTVIYIARLLIGIGLGGCVPPVSVLTSEMVPTAYRGKCIVACIAAMVFGQSSVGFLTYLLLPGIGWNGVSIVVGCLAAYGFVVLKAVPESALWLASKGRHAEADKVMTKIENDIERTTGKTLPAPVEIKASTSEKTVAPSDAQSAATIFSKPHMKSVLVVTVFELAQMAGFYGMTYWLTSFLVMKGITITSSIGYASSICLGGLPAWFFVTYLVDKVGRRLGTVIMALLTAVTVYFYGASATIGVLIVTGLLFMFSQNGYNMAMLVFITEIWPTHLRAQGRGYAQACGRVGSFLGPTLVGYILAAGYSSMTVMYVFVGLAVFGALVVLLFGQETKGQVF